MPNCPICGTEINEGAGFCPKCWRRLVAGQATKGKSKKKLIAIIVPSVIAIVVAIVLATHLVPLPSGHVAEIQYVGLSAYNFSSQFFNPELTGLQRQNLWEDYGGKQVQWTSELKYVSTERAGLVAYFLSPLDWGQIEVRATYAESQRSSLLDLKEGDLVTYTGVLASFGQNQIGLRDCTVVSQALVPLWWDGNIDTHSKRVLVGDKVLCLGPSTYADATRDSSPKIAAINRTTGNLLWRDEQTGSILVGVGSRYVYAWHPVKIVSMSDWEIWYWFASDISALEEVTGQTGWDSYLSEDTHCQLQIGCLPDGWSLSDFVGCCILQGSVKEEITSKGGSGLTFLIDKPPLSELTYEYQGVIYKSACAVYGGTTGCRALQAIDQETGDVLWVMTFKEQGMNDFSISTVDGVLYVSTDEGVGAFKL
jgi:hypothetical protein